MAEFLLEYFSFNETLVHYLFNIFFNFHFYFVERQKERGMEEWSLTLSLWHQYPIRALVQVLATLLLSFLLMIRESSKR